MFESSDIEGLKSGISALEKTFTEFGNTLKDINNYINENINVGPDSAVFGELGGRLLDRWNENAATFSDFQANFESWNQLIAVVASQQGEFTAETMAQYKDTLASNKSTGSTLTSDSESGLSVQEMRDEKLEQSMVSSGTWKGTEGSGTVYEYYDADGHLVTVHKDKNDETVVKKEVRNINKDGSEGSAIETIDYGSGVDENGNVNATISTKDENGKTSSKIERSYNEDGTYVDIYYDADGTEVDKKFYNTDGSVRKPEIEETLDEETEATV